MSTFYNDDLRMRSTTMQEESSTNGSSASSSSSDGSSKRNNAFPPTPPPSAPTSSASLYASNNSSNILPTAEEDPSNDEVSTAISWPIILAVVPTLGAFFAGSAEVWSDFVLSLLTLYYVYKWMTGNYYTYYIVLNFITILILLLI